MKLQPWQVTIIEAHALRLYRESNSDMGLKLPVGVYVSRFRQFLEAISEGDPTTPSASQMAAALQTGKNAEIKDLAVVLGTDLAQVVQYYLAQRGFYQKDAKSGCTSLVEVAELGAELAEKLIPMIHFVRGQPL